jgi:hypothetical protein
MALLSHTLTMGKYAMAMGKYAMAMGKYAITLWEIYLNVESHFNRAARFYFTSTNFLV